MICKSCGIENEEGAVFCSSCGALLAEEAVETVSAPEAPVPEQPPVAEQPQKPSKLMGILSAVLGGLSLLGNASCTCLCGCLGGFPAIVMGIVGLVLGIIGMKKAKDAGTKDTLAIVGLVLSVLALVVCLVVCIVNAIIGGAGAIMESMQGNMRY